jgi:hypothetical protein
VENGVITPRIFNPDISWRGVVNLSPFPLYPRSTWKRKTFTPSRYRTPVVLPVTFLIPLPLMCPCSLAILMVYNKHEQTGNLQKEFYNYEPSLWSGGQSSWLQINRSRVRFPALQDFVSSSGSGTGFTQPREDNWGATWKKSSGSGLENRE